MLAILYTFAGHNYVKFYFGGKADFLELAASINQLCNANRSCPQFLEGWRASSGGRDGLRKGSMLYFPSAREGDEKSANSSEYRQFTLNLQFLSA